MSSNLTSAPTVDPADEAGGEVVFSSDGLDPIPLTRAPPVVSASKNGGEGDDEFVLDSSDISPQQAFEMFQGKVYSVQTTQQRVVGAYSSKEEESPLERLARLQAEVSDLETQFQSLASQNSGRDFDESLVELAGDLKRRLTAASETRALEQEDLTKMVQDQIQSLAAVQDPTSLGGGNFGQTTGITYELYGQAPNAAGGASSARQQHPAAQTPTSTLEERILKLETALGSGSASVVQTKSVSSSSAGSSATTFAGRLDELERLLATVDPAQLEQAATKAKVIRADLEAASKARNKLTSTYKKEDSKMIQELHQQMIDLEGLSGYLPNLVERLQQLSTLHVASSTFNTRLGELEKSTSQVEGTVTQLESTMSELKQTMKDNLSTVQSNLAQLDDSMKKLSE